MNLHTFRLVFLSCLLQLCIASHILGADLTVNVPNLGSVRGSTLKTARLKKTIKSFTGIPYGVIPARFSPAVLREPLTSDNSVFDATKPQLGCVQVPVPGLEQGTFTEDCLTLNIYTPENASPKKPLPVIFYIHGGSFIRWSGNLFDGRRLLDRDVVLVTINYRINIFGFFCLESDASPGNLGLYDQVLALQWVQKYIQSFGGDPNQVTISGQSAGGASVTYLLSSPLASGLFHGAISSSGDDLSGWAIESTPLVNSLAGATAVGCANGTSTNQDLNQVLACMRVLPANVLLAATAVFYSAPVVQNFPLTIPKVTPNNPYYSLVNNLNANVPLMIGNNKNDGSFLLSRTYTALAPTGILNNTLYMKEQFVKALLTSSSFAIVDTPVGIVDSLSNLYLGKSKDSGTFAGLARGLIDIFSVFYFKSAAFLTAKQHCIQSDTYLYSFDYYGQNTLYPYIGGVPQVPRGVTHTDDLIYLFFFGDLTKFDDQLMSSYMVDFYANFATFGNPNQRYAGAPPVVQKWPKFETTKQQFLKINLIATTGNDWVDYWVDASKNIK